MEAAKYNGNLPSNIQTIINRKGLKKQVVAERAGYTPAQLSDMLNGRKIIKVCDVLALADALDVGADELFRRPE